jgi:predicted anti-sigma-YlaC factor YlaD
MRIVPTRVVPRLVLISAVVFLFTGCAVKQVAIRQLGKALASSTGGAFAAEEDVEFAGQAIPFSLKLIESLLYEQPDNPDLSLAAASGFTQYAYVWVQQPADFIENENFAEAQRQRDRARKFFLRAHRYARHALEVKHPDFGARFDTSPVVAVASMKADDVPLLYWAAASLGAAISLGKTDPHLVARQPQMEALLDRASTLDPDWQDGALHELHGSYEPARPGIGDKGLARAKEHLERAIQLHKGRKVSPYVTLAESVYLPQQKRQEFVEALQKALAIDPDADPDIRLGNTALQQRARWLLNQVDDLFLSTEPTSNNP